MPNRFQKNQHDAVAPWITERDGFYCLACFCEGAGHRSEPEVSLEIDHADNDPFNWKPENLHWLCKTHNIKFRRLSVAEHISLMAGYSAKNERARERENLTNRTSKPLDLYREGSIEMRVNSVAEESWLEWMIGMIKANGSISKDDSINAGAVAAMNVSVLSTKRYYIKHTSILGRFMELKENGIVRVTWRTS